MRIFICGGPRVGKTTLFRRLALSHAVAIGTDDFIGIPWGDVPDAVISQLESSTDFVLEGVNAVRVLRRWIKRDPDFTPDVVYYLTQPMAERTPKHWSMAKGIHTQWQDVYVELLRRGTEVILQVPREQEQAHGS